VIVGRYWDKHPRVSLRLAGQSTNIDSEFIVDTGFDGGLTMSAALAHVLGLEWLVTLEPL